MRRKIYQELINWKNTDMQKPLMIIGARQIGKTYIINEFCKREFKKYVYINLLEHAEIDFILYNDDGIIPIEVKANDNVSSKSLNIFIKRYKPKYAIRFSTRNFGYENYCIIKSRHG